MEARNSNKFLIQNFDYNMSNNTKHNNIEIDNNFDEYRKNLLSKDLYSLAMEWRQECTNKSNSFKISVLAPSLLMFGAVLGSFGSGYAADRFGRKPLVVGN